MQRLKEVEGELVTKCRSLKMLAKDDKQRGTDSINVAGILKLIQEIPTKKAVPLQKMVGKNWF